MDKDLAKFAAAVIYELHQKGIDKKTVGLTSNMNKLRKAAAAIKKQAYGEGDILDKKIKLISMINSSYKPLLNLTKQKMESPNPPSAGEIQHSLSILYNMFFGPNSSGVSAYITKEEAQFIIDYAMSKYPGVKDPFFKAEEDFVNKASRSISNLSKIASKFRKELSKKG